MEFTLSVIQECSWITPPDERHEVDPGVPPFLKNPCFLRRSLIFPQKVIGALLPRIQDIEKGLKILTEKYKEWGIESIALPPLGCGNGQLLWDAVGPLIYKYLSQWDIPIKIYAPYGTPREQLKFEFFSRMPSSLQNGTGNRILQKLNPAWVALAEVAYRIERQAYHMPVGRVIFQKSLMSRRL